MLSHFTLAILLQSSFLNVARAVEALPEEGDAIRQLAVGATKSEDSSIMHSVPLFEEAEAIEVDQVSTLSNVLQCLRNFIVDITRAIQKFLVSVLKYLLGILEPLDEEEEEPLSPDGPLLPMRDQNPITIEIDSLPSEKRDTSPAWKTASDESLSHSEGSSLHAHGLKEASRPRRSSVSLLGDSLSTEERLTPVNKLKRMSDSFPRSKGHRNRSASATPSSPGYAAPTVSSMNMRSPVSGRRSSELTRRKKLLEDEREEKLDDIRKRNRLYKDDVLRQLEEQQEERTKYVESIKKSKKPNKLSQSMH
mmetsp:Transcript_1932/g.2966  ORF Transcript_1932/g.2966 Transcript_1932/m.2966 type:complete len:307 (-) Transcript_1932:62-982(-)